MPQHDFPTPLPNESPAGANAWQEFAVTYGTILYTWCAGIDRETGGDYLGWLLDQISESLASMAQLDEQGDEPNRVTLAHPPLTLDRSDVGALMHRLGYNWHGPTHYDPDAASAVILLHSTLERYLEAHGGTTKRGLLHGLLPLIQRAPVLAPYDSTPLPGLDTPLVVDEFDAVRHLLVHSGGIVDDRFVARLRTGGKYALGEPFPLSRPRIWQYFDHVHRVAVHLRRCAA